METNNLIAKKYNMLYCLPVYSGTLAIEGILKLLNLPKKSKVLITSTVCYSILQAILNCDLIPIIAIPKYGITLSKEEVINIVEMEKIKVFIAVHQYGYVQEIPIKKNFIVIEDISQAWNVQCHESEIGQNSDYIISSLGKTKPLSNGIGGLILSNNNFLDKFDLKNREDRYKSHTLIQYYYPGPINYKQLIRKANKKVRFQRKNAKMFSEIFKKYNFINIINYKNSLPSFHRYVVEIEQSYLEGFMDLLNKLKINYQKEYKIKLDELPISKIKRIKIIGKNNKSVLLLFMTNNKIIKLRKLSKEMEKKYGNKSKDNVCTNIRKL